MSVLGKKWKVKNTNTDKSVLEKLFENRGLGSMEEIDKFLFPKRERDFHDPYLMEDMATAVERIERAIENKERIMVFGDYDVDGITGCTILMRCLRQLGAEASCRLPHRVEDGYGMREKFVRQFHELGVKVIITVDNGVSALNEVKIANELGVDVIITDHHTVPAVMPPALAILHPKLPKSGYPFTELTGAGVALKLAQALFEKRLPDAAPHINALMDLACMGTISDLAELTGENRYIVKEGLKALAHTRWPGLSRLKKNARVEGEVDTFTIGFQLGPRINAAGRMDHPEHALRLLLNDTAQTEEFAKTLEDLNQKRQKLMLELISHVESHTVDQKNAPCIVISDERFHAGVIGLIAARLAEKYTRPAIVMEERGKICVGSCRSIPGINVVDALRSVSDLLTHFGGHAAAAGFELEKKNLLQFKKRVAQYFKKTFDPKSHILSVTAECEISPKELTLATFQEISKLAPFGVGNEKPRFICRGLPVLRWNLMGKEKQHLKFTTSIGSNSIECVGFSFAQYLPLIKESSHIDLICELEKNEWQGRKTLQLKIIDVRASSRSQEQHEQP